jgi:acetyl esterase/lipase
MSDDILTVEGAPIGVVLEPVARAFAGDSASPPYLYQLDPAEGRQIVDRLQASPAHLLAADLTDVAVPGGPAGEVRVRVVRPPGSAGPLPVILYIHGLGWVFGSPDTHDRLVRGLAVGVGAAVVVPDYSLSPEATYPTAIEEIFAVATWIAASGGAHGPDPSRIAIAGDSVGGNMAAALTRPLPSGKLITTEWHLRDRPTVARAPSVTARATIAKLRSRGSGGNAWKIGLRSPASRSTWLPPWVGSGRCYGTKIRPLGATTPMTATVPIAPVFRLIVPRELAG